MALEWLSPAPDFVEPIVAWRVWRTQQDRGRTWLRSVYRGVRWPVEEPLAARCVRRGLGRSARADHRAPAEGCDCGIYGVSRFFADEVKHLERQFDCLVLGQVSLWGVVWEHDQGWRASLGYPVRLCVWKRSGYRYDVGRLADGLKAYGVPVGVVESRSLARAFAEVEATWRTRPRGSRGSP